jgi:hypothetical protein
MQRAIESAHTAQAEYFASTTAATRGKMLQKWHDLVMENINDCTPTHWTYPTPDNPKEKKNKNKNKKLTQPLGVDV